MLQPILLHCNYVEQGQSIDQMCALAKRWGYEGIEFRRARSGVTESVDQYLDQISHALAAEKLAYVTFGAPGPNLILADAGARQKEIDNYIAFLRGVSNRFGPVTLNTIAGGLTRPNTPMHAFDQNGSACATDAHWQQSIDGFKVIAQVATELKMRLAFETHMNYLHDLAAPARKLVDAIDSPAIGINLDYANMFCFAKPVTMDEAVRTCGDKTYLVHLKNMQMLAGLERHQHVRCGLGDGDINNRQLVKLIRMAGYKGPWVLEAPRPGDREWFAQQDIHYFKSLLTDLAT